MDAHYYETRQDWVGIMLAPSTVKKMPDLREWCRINIVGSAKETIEAARKHVQWSAFVQPCDEIPLHSEQRSHTNEFQGLAIVPTDGQYKFISIRDSLDRSLKELQRLLFIAPDPMAQAKYQRSINWLEQVLHKWRVIADNVEGLEKSKQQEEQRRNRPPKSTFLGPR